VLMQAQADLLQVPVLRSRSAAADATALGVAALARLGTGEAGSVGEALGPAEVEDVVEPSITADQAAERLAGFRSAVEAILAER
jgi:glycerol kinase